MIKTYYRPTSLDEALSLLSNPEEKAKPLGGGTRISKHKGPEISVVDLQELGLNNIEKSGGRISTGAMVRLDALLKNIDKQSWAVNFFYPANGFGCNLNLGAE